MYKGAVSALSKVVRSRSITIEQKKKKKKKKKNLQNLGFWSCKNSSIAIELTFASPQINNR